MLSWRLELSDQCRTSSFVPNKSKVDGFALYAGLVNGTICEWTGTGAPRSFQHCHSGPVTCVVPDSSGTTLVSTGKDCSVRVWSDRGIVRLRLHRIVNSACFASGAQDRVLFGGQDSMVHLAEVEDLTICNSYTTHQDHVSQVVSYNETCCASASTDKSSQLIDFREARTPAVKLMHPGWVYGVTAHAETHLVATACRDRQARIWDVRNSAHPLSIFTHGSGVTCCHLSKTGTLLATGSVDTSVFVRSVESGQVHHFYSHANGVATVQFNDPQHDLLVSNSFDGNVRVLDLAHSCRAQADSLISAARLPKDLSPKLVEYLW